MRNKCRLYIIEVLLYCMAVSLVSACNNSIDPIDTENGIFAIYGTLDLNKEINYIRVRDMNTPFTEEATRDIDAEVTLENLDSGFVEVLEVHRVEYEDIYLHNFKVTQQILPNTEYRVTVLRSDGRSVSKVITTPTKPVPQANPTNENCYTPIEVSFDPVFESTITYRIGFQLSFGDTLFSSRQVLRRSDTDEDQRVSFNFTPDDILSIRPGGSLSCQDLARPNFYVSYVHYSSGFYESILEDPFDIFESTQRFGAVYYDILTIPIDVSRVCPQDC